MKKKVYLISTIFLIIDILSKTLIDNFLELNQSLKIINNFFYLTKVYNDGASFSILSGYQIVLIILSFIILVFIYFYQKKFKDNIRNTLAFSFLIAGIIGNLINRIFFGYVIDFLDFKIINYNYPVFNFADIFIVLGVLLIIIAILKKEDENELGSR